MTHTDPYDALLVDDNRHIRRIYAQLLELSPDLAVAGQAGSGEEALEKVATLGPDIVVAERSMPGIGGCQLTRRMRELSLQVPVLIISTSGERAYVRQALAAGANGYLVKRCSESTLTDAVRHIRQGGYFLCDHFLCDETRRSLRRIDNLGAYDFS